MHVTHMFASTCTCGSFQHWQGAHAGIGICICFFSTYNARESQLAERELCMGTMTWTSGCEVRLVGIIDEIYIWGCRGERSLHLFRDSAFIEHVSETWPYAKPYLAAYIPWSDF